MVPVHRRVNVRVEAVRLASVTEQKNSFVDGVVRRCGDGERVEATDNNQGAAEKSGCHWFLSFEDERIYRCEEELEMLASFELESSLSSLWFSRKLE